jgi:aerobic C4-dicarboxylate transport protein
VTRPTRPTRGLHRNLTVQVLVAIAAGAALGTLAPDAGRAMKPLGDTFVNLVKMVIAPVVFLTIVLGIANMSDMRRVGRVGGKALLYFEIMTTLALAIGLAVVNLTQPGRGIEPSLRSGQASALLRVDVSQYAAQAKEMRAVDVLLHAVPSSIVDAFARGDVLQVVFVAVLFGAALTALGAEARPVIDLFERLSRVFFRIVAIVMVVAPIGAFGAMAYTVGTFGVAALVPLARLMLDVYVTMALFVFVVINLVLRRYGFRLWPYLRFIREEILLVLGTSSSEAALPGLLDKMERYGCARSIVGLVVPAGYSFNLDGTSIYLSMATLFIAQAFGVHLSLAQQLELIAVLMLTSKGAAGVTGSGFIVLASTLSAMRVVPVEGIALVLGVDRFMSEARAITNLIGNGAAALVISRSEGQFDDAKRERAEVEQRGVRDARA